MKTCPKMLSIYYYYYNKLIRVGHFYFCEYNMLLYLLYGFRV